MVFAEGAELVSILLLLFVVLCGFSAARGETRPPAVAGQFYPDDPEMLRKAVAFYLGDAMRRPVAEPVAFLAPHAGYVYSAQIAADAYKQVEGERFSTVVVIGTNHSVAPFHGAAVWPDGAFRTPLGDVPVDAEFAKRLMAADARFLSRTDAHREEHSIEVQLPFIQTLFPRAKIVPIVMGSADLDLCTSLGNALAEAAAGRRVLLVASSDLSHYPSQEDATVSDTRVLRAVAGGDPAEVKAAIAGEMDRGARGLSTCACGEGAILTVMQAAKRMGATRAVVLSYANSGDTPLGEAGRVVGYGAIVFGKGDGAPDLSALEAPRSSETRGPLTEEEKRLLLGSARSSIEQYLSTRTAPLPRFGDPALSAKRGAFVTLKRGGALRGCIGHMAEDRPLCQVVGAMALQAAFNDRRFAPLSMEEWGDVTLEISVLTPRREIRKPEEVVIGRDGVVIEKGGSSAVFLPQVAPEQGWSREEMLEHLCAKAGLPGGCWREGARLFVFQAEVFGEEDAR